MQLSSFIDEYRSCDAALGKAVQVEDDDAVRELDLRMAWLRKVIRAYPARNEYHKRQQIDFFMDVVSKATDHHRDLSPLADLEWIIDRNIGPGAERHAPVLNGRSANCGEAGRALFDGLAPRSDALAMIEKTNLRMAVIGRDFQYRYTTPGNGQFHDLPVEAFRDKHLADLIGEKRFSGRAKAYLERCFAGEDITYCYFLDTEAFGRLLLECRMLTLRAGVEADNAALLVVRDLTAGYLDPVRSAEENSV